MTGIELKKSQNNFAPAQGREDNLLSLYTSARESFAADDFDGASRFCRKASTAKISAEELPTLCEVYYLGCLAAMKSSRPDEVIDICSGARARLGDFLDLAFFELIAASSINAVVEVPRLAEKYMRLWKLTNKEDHPYKQHTFGLAGQVMLMWGQALEQLGEPVEALTIYKQYLNLHPEDRIIESRIVELETLK